MSIKPITTTLRLRITRFLIITALKCCNSLSLGILTIRNLATSMKTFAQFTKEVLWCSYLLDSIRKAVSSISLLAALSLQCSCWHHCLMCTEKKEYSQVRHRSTSFSRIQRARSSHEMFEKFMMEVSEGWQAARKLWVKPRCVRESALNSKWDRAIQLS